jgi:exodeoxyribonuclease X
LGPPPHNEIVTFALLEIDHDLNILAEFDAMVQPRGLISAEAAGVHGITNRMVEGLPTIEEMFAGAHLGDEDFSDVLICCHNVPFDRPLLAPHMNITGEFCTLRAARKIYPNAPNHKLPTLRHWLEIEVDGANHGAAADVACTYELIKCMMRDTGLSLQELIEDTRRPIIHTTMPFGKHAGKPLAEVPRGYLNWLREQPNMDKDLDASFRLVGR